MRKPFIGVVLFMLFFVGLIAYAETSATGDLSAEDSSSRICSQKVRDTFDTPSEHGWPGWHTYSLSNGGGSGIWVEGDAFLDVHGRSPDIYEENNGHLLLLGSEGSNAMETSARFNGDNGNPGWQVHLRWPGAVGCYRDEHAQVAADEALCATVYDDGESWVGFCASGDGSVFGVMPPPAEIGDPHWDELYAYFVLVQRTKDGVIHFLPGDSKLIADLLSPLDFYSKVGKLKLTVLEKGDIWIARGEATNGFDRFTVEAPLFAPPNTGGLTGVNGIVNASPWCIRDGFERQFVIEEAAALVCSDF